MQRFLKSRNFLMALLLSAVSTTAFGQIGSAITTTLAAPWMKMSISAAFVIWAIFTLVKNWESILGGTSDAITKVIQVCALIALAKWWYDIAVYIMTTIVGIS